MSDTIYTVSLTKGFPYPQRVRSGIMATQTVPYEGPLTDAQLKAIKADSHLTLKEVRTAAKPASKK
jgi:hypothetical protein